MRDRRGRARSFVPQERLPLGKGRSLLKCVHLLRTGGNSPPSRSRRRRKMTELIYSALRFFPPSKRRKARNAPTHEATVSLMVSGQNPGSITVRPWTNSKISHATSTAKRERRAAPHAIHTLLRSRYKR